MKIQQVISSLAAGLLVLGGAALISCEQPAEPKTITKTETVTVEVPVDASDFSGTAKFYFPVHQSGILAEAEVTTDKTGTVTDAKINEWMDPKSWVYSTGSNGALVGGEMIRIKMAGKNTTSTLTGVSGYTFFYYNIASLGWVEFTPSVGATIPTSSTTAATANFDFKMAAVPYAKAYAEACAAATADATNTDLTTVTFADATGKVSATTTVTVSADNAAKQIAQRTSKSTTVDTTKGGNLNKRDLTSAYFAMAADKLGYRTNYARLISYFAAHPQANYAGATQLTVYTSGWVSGTDAADATAAANAYVVTLPSAVVGTADVLTTAKTLKVWSVDGTVDTMTGATYSDFPAYALGLQNAYLFALADIKGGNVRALK